jgi:hypothetical protein
MIRRSALGSPVSVVYVGAMPSRVVLTLAAVLWLLSPIIAAAQSSARAETDYKKGNAYYRSRPPDYVNAAVCYRRAFDTCEVVRSAIRHRDAKILNRWRNRLELQLFSELMA